MSTKDYGLTRNKPGDRPGVWQCDFYSGKRRFQLSTFTTDRAAAEEYCRTLDAGAWREAKLGEAPQITWANAVVRWFDEKTLAGNKDLANDRDKASALAPFLDDTWLHELTEKQCNDALKELADEREWAIGTHNHHSAFITRVMNVMRELKFKVADFKLKKIKQGDRDVRFLTREEATELLRQLPLHLKRMVEFSLLTGLRQSNVTGLLWRNVDLARGIAWIQGAESKSGKPIKVQLPPRAVELLKEARDCEKHGHKQIVFTYYKALVDYPAQGAWEKALERAGIADFRWHDLRHTWASWHVMGWWSSKGTPTPLAVLQLLGGWHSVEMVQRYAHLSPDFTDAFKGDLGVSLPEPLPANVVPLRA
jgi:integrase